MERDDKILKLIESQAKDILRANGYEPQGVDGWIGDGCIIIGEPLWVFWPLIDGSDDVAVYANSVTSNGIEISRRDPEADDSLITLGDLVPGYRDMQKFLEQVESRIR